MNYNSLGVFAVFFLLTMHNPPPTLYTPKNLNPRQTVYGIDFKAVAIAARSDTASGAIKTSQILMQGADLADSDGVGWTNTEITAEVTQLPLGLVVQNGLDAITGDPRLLVNFPHLMHGVALDMGDIIISASCKKGDDEVSYGGVQCECGRFFSVKNFIY